jgi:polyhydroxybutyrate depolymerase
MQTRVVLLGLVFGSLVACSGEDSTGGPAGSGGDGAKGGAGAGSGGGSGSSGTLGSAGTLGAGGAQGGTGGALGSGGSAGTAGASGGALGSGGAGGGGAAGSGGGAGAGGTDGVGGTGGGPTCTGSTLRPGENTRTLQVGGVSRTYILHVPASYTGSTPVPLVVDFHPILFSGSFERGNSGYLELSDQEGFIVAWPNGIDNAWNVGPCCTRSRTVDDLGFAKALVDQIKAEGCVDPKRVYATGFSMGGGMSQFLGCNAADVFAAIAPSAFDLLQESEEPCHPSRPISVILFRGTADNIVPYAGGASRPPNGLNVTIHFLGARATFQRWAELNGCTGSPVAGAGGCETYAQCREGAEVTLCTAQGGGHSSGDERAGWEMMKKHPIP